MNNEFIVFNQTQEVSLGSRIRIADSFWSRLRGLLGRPQLPLGEGLLLIPCASVHTFGMRFAIDVVFISDLGMVLKVFSQVVPGKLIPRVRGAYYALELPAGTAAGVEPGDKIVWRICGDNDT